MKEFQKILACGALVAALGIAQAQTTSTSPTPAPAIHKRTARKAVPKGPSVESQIQQLREDMENQIQQLKQQLSDRDQQLQQAQQAAAAAQAAAAQAQQATAQQQSAAAESTQTVNQLQSAVDGLKTNNTSLAATVQAQQTEVHKAIDNPDTLHYKGITLSPNGSFLAAETVYRQRATGGGINTPFTSLPLADQPEYDYSEFYGSGRQSRVAMLAQGTIPSMTLRGYYEADFLSAGVTSNNNQSNSYTLRQRQVWAQAALQNGWTFTGGQMWSLATENISGITNRTEATPLTIDPQYEPGFVWARQYGFRVTKNYSNKMFVGVSVENPQIPSISGHNIPYNFLIGQLGTGGGLYDTVANYTSNVAPDFVAKIALEPGWGHYEIFGISRFFRDRVYPNDTGTTPSAAGAYNDTTTGGGIGGSLRVPTFAKHLDVGLKGLWGDGIGRYGDSQIADTTVHPDGQLAPIHGFSALSTLEFHPTPRLDVYVNYGGDYAGRRYFLTSKTSAVGYGSPTNVETGCGTEAPPASGNVGFTPGTESTCVADTKDLQQLTVGYWYNFYSGPAGRLRQGIQYSYAQRNIWSGVGPTPTGTDNMFWTSFRYYLP